MVTFEKWLSEIIKAKGINISEMVRKTNTSYQAVYSSLFDKHKRRELRSSELIAICRYVGVNPMDFLEKKEGEFYGS